MKELELREMAARERWHDASALVRQLERELPRAAGFTIAGAPAGGVIAERLKYAKLALADAYLDMKTLRAAMPPPAPTVKLSKSRPVALPPRPAPPMSPEQRAQANEILYQTTLRLPGIK